MPKRIFRTRHIAAICISTRRSYFKDTIFFISERTTNHCQCRMKYDCQHNSCCTSWTPNAIRFVKRIFCRFNIASISIIYKSSISLSRQKRQTIRLVYNAHKYIDFRLLRLPISNRKDSHTLAIGENSILDYGLI